MSIRIEYQTDDGERGFFTTSHEHFTYVVDALRAGVWLKDERDWWINPASITMVRPAEQADEHVPTT